MATVYLAEDLRHKRHVAIKVLKPELAAVLGADRFVQEIATTASLQHPHILPLFDSGTADGFLFYVMPYIEGETLRDKLDRETQLGIDEAVRITREVADALDYAHRHGIIHRDIKPENILLHDGRPMVSDFGIALAVSAAAGGRITETGMSVGTPLYMSPEQATADRKITNRSDIYSLGAVLYEMLAGEPPHAGATGAAVLMRIISEVPRPLADYRRSVPVNVAAAVGKALEKLAADRFESATAFADALSNAAYGEVSEEVVRLRVRTGRVRQLSVLAVGGFVLAGAFAAGLWLGGGSPEPFGVGRLSINLEPGTDLIGTRGQDECCNQGRPSLPAIALSPDGHTLVFAGQRGGIRQLFSRPIEQEAAVPIPDTEGAEGPIFSPDGREVAFWASGWIRRIPLTGGPAVQIAAVETPFGMSWGDDGRIVFRDGNVAGLRRVAVSGGSIEALNSAPDARLPDVLPGSMAVLYTANAATVLADVYIESLRLDDGARDTVVRNAAAARYIPTGHLLFAREGKLMAVAFDAARIRTREGPIGVLSDVMQATGGVHPDVRTDAAQYAVSQSGHLAYLTGGITQPYARRVAWLDRQGQMVDLDLPSASYVSARISPDGRTLAVGAPGGGEPGLWVVDRDRPASMRRLLDGTVPFFAWSPDSRRIAFGAFDGIRILDTHGGTAPELLLPVASAAERLSVALWTGDDQILFLAVDSSGNLALQAVDVATRQRRVVLSENGADIAYPVLSPDGRTLAYAHATGTQAEVVVRPWPSLDRRLVVAAGTIYGIAWARDGRDLLFAEYHDPMSNSMIAVDMSASVNREAGEPQPLFTSAISRAWPLRAWDVALDEERFLTLRTEESSQPPEPSIHVVLNWSRELRNR